MMDQRHTVLDNIRRQLKRDVTDPQPGATVRRRLQAHSRNTVPARADGSRATLLDLFEQMLTGVQGSVTRISSADGVPLAVLDYLAVREADICINGEVEHLPWDAQPGIHLVPWAAKSSLGVTVTGCFAAAAETGTVVITSSSRNPLTLNLLAERHIVILFADQLVGSYEAIWDKIRAAGKMPRDITFVSGPSCTGDIEMMMEYGAHGPRSLHVIVVEEDTGATR